MVIASSDIKVGHSPPFDCHGVAQKLQNVVKAANYRCGDNDILEKSSMRYYQEVIKRLNRKEDDHEEKKKRTCTGLVKVSRLRNTRSSQSDTKLAGIMFHKLDDIYRYLKHQ